MAELLMECEEEELEPWQQRAKEIDVDDDDDDDEPIFVREISGSKTPNTSNNTPVAKPSPSTQVENGTPTRGVNTFQTLSNHYKPPAATHSVTQPISPMYLPVTRPVTSSAVVQPLPRPIGMQEPIRRPLTGCLPAQQPPRPNLIMQPACRPMTFASNNQPVSRNITFPTVSQPALRPVATITAQPVILNQSYIVNSPQVSSNNSPNVMYALRQSTPLSQYQSMQTITTTGSSTPLARPLQPLPQIRPLSTPARTAPTYIHRPTPPIPSVTQNNMNLVPVLQQPLLQNSQKTQQTILTQSSAANIGRNENALMEKRSAPPDITSVSPKKPKTNENVINNRSIAASTTTSTPTSTPMRHPTTQSQNTPTKGTVSGTTPIKNGTPFPQACPKCNIHFNLLEPMKKHMTFCCPEKMQSFGVTNLDASKPQSTVDENDKGKLIMLVSDFYYGKHSGDPQLIQQEQKTHTTFKCFSCQKVLKNNVRFMNHMKHHLELEKQSTESWENHTTCHHCYRQFPTPFQLQCHIESSHTLYESTTICKICELSFDSEQILLQHMKDNHKPGEMPYVCQVCNYRSSLFGDVDSHFRATHENTKSLLCPFCLKVIKSGTPFMQHYMKHQNKGVYRCAKCRLQFLTCKEKMDHKTQHHRTFRKPKQLEGLPPGTKVTIRASIGATTSPVTSPTSSISKKPAVTPPQKAPPQPPPVTPPQPPPKVKNTAPKINSTPTAKVKVKSPKVKSHPKKPATPSTTRRMKTTNTALRNIRFISGVHKCMECHRQVVDFEGHFHTYVHCSKCKFSTSCNKAYTKHMMSFHGRNSSKRSKTSRKGPKDKRRITVVCLNCDFLTDVSGLDDMAKHLSESHTHSCQVVTENVSIFSSTHEGDMSKSRFQSSVEQKKIGRQGKKTVSNIDAVTDDSKKEKYTPGAAKNEKNACGSTRTSHGQRGKLLYNRNTTSVDQVTVTSDTPDSCSPKPEEKEGQLIDSNNKDSCDIIQEKLSCEETSPEAGKPADNDTVTTDNDEELCSVDKVEALPDSELASDDVGFEQFLRKEAPDSVSSDVSEPSSVHLDPLTPSEVLEHEATEILQKGTTIDSQKGSNEEKTEDTKDSSTNISSQNETEEEQEAVL